MTRTERAKHLIHSLLTSLLCGYFLSACGSNTVGTDRLEPVPAEFTIGGSVKGLIGMLALENAGHGKIIVTERESDFTFPIPLREGEQYSVSILSEPFGQRCKVLNSKGIMPAESVDEITIECDKAVSVYADIHL